MEGLVEWGTVCVKSEVILIMVWWYGIPDLSLYKKYVWKYVGLFIYCNSIVTLHTNIQFQLINLAIFPLRDELFLSEKACSKKAIRLGYSSRHIRIRIKEEYILLKRYASLLFGYFLALIYPYPIVMRNFSFYLHHTMKDYVEDESTLRHKTLYDLGHQAIYIFFVFWNFHKQLMSNITFLFLPISAMLSPYPLWQYGL